MARQALEPPRCGGRASPPDTPRRREADAGGGFDDAGGKLRQAQADGGDVGSGERMGRGNGVVQLSGSASKRRCAGSGASDWAGGLWQLVRSEASWALSR